MVVWPWGLEMSTRDKDPIPQGLNRDFGLPTQRALEEHGEVVGNHSQGQGGLGGVEAFADQSGDPKAVLEFLDHILAVGAPVITTPYPQGILFQRPARDHGLKEVFR